MMLPHRCIKRSSIASILRTAFIRVSCTPANSVLRPRASHWLFCTLSSSSTDLWSSPPPYFRIRIVHPKDMEATYPLLASYALDPDAASTVKELAMDTEGWPESDYRSCRSDGSNPLNEPAKPVNEAAHELLEERTRNLGLDQSTTHRIIKALAWKKAHLPGQKPDCPEGFATHNREYTSAATTLLLSFCKNITRFYLGMIHPCDALIEYLLKSNYGMIPVEKRALQNLGTVKIVGMTRSILNDERYYRTAEFLELLSYFHRLPKFKTYILDAQAEYQMDREVFAPKTSSPSFKRIQMRHVEASSCAIGMLLRAPLGLEEFVISIGGLFTSDSGQWSVARKTIHKCFLTQKDTLRVLDLDIGGYGVYTTVTGENGGTWEEEGDGYEDDCEDDHDYDELERIRNNEYFLMDEAASIGPLYACEFPDMRKYGYTIGSFHDFTALTHLSISISNLMGPDANSPPATLAVQPPFRLFEALPPNLEYLRLYGYERGRNMDIDEHVDEFMQKKAKLYPRLRKVVGVEEKILGEGSRYQHASQMREVQLWEREEPEVGWVEAK